MDKTTKKHQIIIKICCVIAAFGLWLYTSSILNPIRTYKKQIPVTIINESELEQSKLVIVPGQEFSIKLTLKGTINDVYSAKADEFKIVADLGAYGLKKGENNIPVKIVESPDNIQIVNDGTLFVNINLDGLTEKKVPLKVNTYGEAKEGFFVENPIYKSDSATVKGPESIVKKVDRVEAKYDISNADKDLQLNLSLKPVDANGKVVSGVNTNPSDVEITIPIRKTKTVGVNVKTTGSLNSNLILKSISAIPEKIEIAGDEQIISDINNLDTESIDLSSINDSAVKDAKLVLPKGVTLINNDSGIKIKVLIENIVQKTISLDVKVNNLSSEYEAKLENDKVSIVISGDNSILQNIDDSKIECFLDLNSLKEGIHKVPVQVNLPTGASQVSISSKSIQVDIKKKSVEVNNAN